MFRHLCTVMGEVWIGSRLDDGQQHQVRKFGHAPAMKCCCTVLPRLCESQAFPSNDVTTISLAEVGVPFEAGRIDDAVNLVLLPGDHEALFCQSFNPSTICVDKVHIRQIERLIDPSGQSDEHKDLPAFTTNLEIIIMKARPLAELVVPLFSQDQNVDAEAWDASHSLV